MNFCFQTINKIWLKKAFRFEVFKVLFRLNRFALPTFVVSSRAFCQENSDSNFEANPGSESVILSAHSAFVGAPSQVKSFVMVGTIFDRSEEKKKDDFVPILQEAKIQTLGAGGLLVLGNGGGLSGSIAAIYKKQESYVTLDPSAFKVLPQSERLTQKNIQAMLNLEILKGIVLHGSLLGDWFAGNVLGTFNIAVSDVTSYNGSRFGVGAGTTFWNPAGAISFVYFNPSRGKGLSQGESKVTSAGGVGGIRFLLKRDKTANVGFWLAKYSYVQNQFAVATTSPVDARKISLFGVSTYASVRPLWEASMGAEVFFGNGVKCLLAYRAQKLAEIWGSQGEVKVTEGFKKLNQRVVLDVSIGSDSSNLGWQGFYESHQDKIRKNESEESLSKMSFGQKVVFRTQF